MLAPRAFQCFGVARANRAQLLLAWHYSGCSWQFRTKSLIVCVCMHVCTYFLILYACLYACICMYMLHEYVEVSAVVIHIYIYVLSQKDFIRTSVSTNFGLYFIKFSCHEISCTRLFVSTNFWQEIVLGSYHVSIFY